MTQLLLISTRISSWTSFAKRSQRSCDDWAKEFGGAVMIVAAGVDGMVDGCPYAVAQ
jgi:hypothetical protein